MNMSKSAIGFALAMALGGCSQGVESPWTASREPSSTTAQELSAVQGCESQAHSCFSSAATAADKQACEDSLRSCLSSLFGDAGWPSSGAWDGGQGFPGAGNGGGFPGSGGFGGFGGDGGCPSGHGGSGGGRGSSSGGPSGDDGGTTQPPPPSNDGGSGTVADACVQTLQSCLSSGTAADTCASNAETCLRQTQTAQ
jgi:hypothetical protein